MPTIEFSISDLKRLIGRELSVDELEELLTYVKGEVEEINNDNIKVEIKDTLRPDLWSVEGIARQLKGILEIEMGIPRYDVKKSDYEIIVDNEIVNIRPYIAAAVVKNVDLGKDGLSSLIQLQEKVVKTYGRNRKKIAIGTHNLDLIEFPIYYKAVDPDSVKFVPLKEDKEMTLREIIEKTEKGKEYAHLINRYDKFPLLMDAKNEVISFPPIINSNRIGRLLPDTKNIFIDVTGTDLQSVLIALNVVVTALADRGGEIYGIYIKYPDRTEFTPDLSEKKIKVSMKYLKKWSGLDVSIEDVIKLLKKFRFDVKVENDEIEVLYLPYRADILTPQDIVEDLVISYGYNNIEPEEPKVYSIGKELEIKEFVEKIREYMVSIGAIEINTTVLHDKNEQQLFSDVENIIEIENPVSSKYNVVRNSIIPEILDAVFVNKRYEYPQEFFSIGTCVKREGNNILEDLRLAYGYTDVRVTFTDVKQRLESLFELLGIKYTLKEEDLKGFIPGRCGKIMMNNEGIGVIGEIHPRVLEYLNIEVPVAIFEISLKKLYKLIKNSLNRS